MKVALITGITGQDGAYLTKLLLKKNYKVIGLTRSRKKTGIFGLEYLGVEKSVILEECDLMDLSQVIALFKKYIPDEIYNLAAQSSVSLSFNQPIGTIQFNVLSVLNLLEAIRILGVETKYYQASSSEIFGQTELPITEKKVINPLSPYGISKASAHLITKNYREAYGLFSCSGILFNHESYLRNSNFFVKKVIVSALNIVEGKTNELRVGNIEIKRDFGWAPKYVEAMYLMMQNSKPDDFVICSGHSYTLREIIEYVFDQLNIKKSRIIVDSNFYRPTDITDIYGDNTKAKKVLGWEYEFSFYEILDILIQEELDNKNVSYDKS